MRSRVIRSICSRLWIRAIECVDDGTSAHEPVEDAVPDARRVTFENLELNTRGWVTVENWIINGKPMPEGSPATGADRAKLIGELMPAEYRQ